MILRERLSNFLDELLASEEIVRIKFLNLDEALFSVSSELEELGVCEVLYKLVPYELIVVKCNSDYLVDMSLDSLVESHFVSIRINICNIGNKVGHEYVIDYNNSYFTNTTIYFYNMTVNVNKYSAYDFYTLIFQQKFISNCKIVFVDKFIDYSMFKSFINDIDNTYTFDKISFNYKLKALGLKMDYKNDLSNVFDSMLLLIKEYSHLIKGVELIIVINENDGLSTFLFDIKDLYKSLLENNKCNVLKDYLETKLVINIDTNSYLSDKNLTQIKETIELLSKSNSVVIM